MIKMVNQFVIGGDNEAVELKDVKLVKNDHGYCLDLTYLVEDDKKIREFNIPCLRLPIDGNKFLIRNERCEYYSGYTANVGFGMVDMITVNGASYTMKTIKEKTKEMTLEEIEKKLGHKVKIVDR